MLCEDGWTEATKQLTILNLDMKINILIQRCSRASIHSVLLGNVVSFPRRTSAEVFWASAVWVTLAYFVTFWGSLLQWRQLTQVSNISTLVFRDLCLTLLANHANAISY